MTTILNSSKASEICNHIVQGDAISPGNRFFALYSDVFAGTEVTGGDYARVDCTTVMPNASSGQSTNDTEAVFANSSPATTIDGVGIWTASSGGTEIMRWDLTVSRTVTSGDILRFPVGSLTVGDSGGA